MLLTLPLLLAMSGGDGSGPTRIPEPDKNYRVELTDVSGSRVTLEHFALDSQTFVLGNMGQGEVAVPFDRVKALSLVNKEGVLTAVLNLADGEKVELAMNGRLKATGRTEYGNYRIPLSEVMNLVFLGRVLPQAQ